MPFVEPPRKRRRDDQGEEFLYNFFSPKRAQQDQLNSPREWPLRKVIPLTSKRARFDYRPQEHLLHEKPYDIYPKQKSKGTNLLLTPCHICGDHPSRVSQLDAFAHCQDKGTVRRRTAENNRRSILESERTPEYNMPMLLRGAKGDGRGGCVPGLLPSICGRDRRVRGERQQWHRDGALFTI
ncbi:uncharacterized protein F5Z01DRAFT_313703 [Emericellopsis atlantica]|uniref:Uncharacterized protein n=1 Tax=Emericellopsis atlantica TaxID=2614577 RepID=A0A9P7ZTC8_9HYPO|nr:uncharacterized protein F5Z01DRAFT_313703 [Emericellopsis atlantica]KAG9257993.1 hypothetical protein F5Z01DRAFT_313703 [Emericellopsis atlantica]